MSLTNHHDLDAHTTATRNALMRRLVTRGIDSRVLAAIEVVPRHELVPEALRRAAYHDGPLPIGREQTISQPSLVAMMTMLAEVGEHDRVLEIGTGSGYQAAVLGQLAGEIYTIEIIEALGRRAREDLTRLGLADNIHFRIGDGYAGWPDAAPFDAIVVTAAPASVPAPLIDQLAASGRMVIPVGAARQQLRVLTKTERGVMTEDSIPVRFVPMTGMASIDAVPRAGTQP